MVVQLSPERKQMDSIRAVLSKKIGMDIEINTEVDPMSWGLILVGGRILTGQRSARNDLGQRLKIG